MTVYVQVVAVAALDSSPCVVVATETYRFLFDCGEGTQRLCVEQKIKLGKIDCMFFTASNCFTLGGLPGLSLTCADSGRSGLRLIGPSGIQNYWDATQFFMRRPGFEVIIEEITSEKDHIPSYSSNELCVTPVPLCDRNGDVKVVSYICQSPELPGKFDIAKATALQIPKGPLFGKLKTGHSITLADGRVIQPEDVLGESDKSKFFAIVGSLDNCGYDILNALLDERWTQFKSSGNHRLECMIHYSGRGTINRREYREWMDSFGSDTKHILIGDGATHAITSFSAITTYTQKLKYLFPHLFSEVSIFPSDGSKERFVHELPKLSQTSDVDNKVVEGVPRLKFHIKPNRLTGFDSYSLYDLAQSESSSLKVFQEEMYTNYPTCMSEISDVNAVRTELLSGSQLTEYGSLKANEPQASQFINNHSDKIHFLGTGCAIPSKYRNVSSILLDISTAQNGQKFFLFDAGEGTWFQLTRALSSDHLGKFEIANKLELIWISHPHADHHLGLVSIITERWRLLHDKNIHNEASPLLVVAPPSILAFLHKYSNDNPVINIHGQDLSFRDAYVGVPTRLLDPYDDFQKGDIFLSLDSNTDYRAQFQSEVQFMEALLTRNNISFFQNVKVDHCAQSYGVAITFSRECGDLKIVYSGDTRPCLDLIQLGENASVLIHEATFEDSMQVEALAKRHSTIGEAASIAKGMKAFRLILTHFSQRYQSFPQVDPESYEYKNMTFAFDFMKLSLHDLLWSPLTTKIFAKAFPPKNEEDEDETPVPHTSDETTSNAKKKPKKS